MNTKENETRADDRILLAHGSGGAMSHDLIASFFVKAFQNPVLDRLDDMAVLEIDGTKLAFTKDSYVVTPVFFPGGDIGKLAVCGPINDLAMSGARPLYLSAGFILEEGFPLRDLEAIIASMQKTAAQAGVQIVTGDTKVVNRGGADGVFINTAGLGRIPEGVNISGRNARPGDKVLVCVNGYFGERMAHVAERLTNNLRVLPGTWGAPFDPAVIEKEIKSFHKVSSLEIGPVSLGNTVASFITNALAAQFTINEPMMLSPAGPFCNGLLDTADTTGLVEVTSLKFDFFGGLLSDVDLMQVLQDLIALVPDKHPLIWLAKAISSKAVKVGVAQLSALVEECQDAGVLEITNYNGPDQLVLSGEAEAVATAMELIRERRLGRAVLLNVSAQFHSSLMMPAAEAFNQE